MLSNSHESERPRLSIFPGTPKLQRRSEEHMYLASREQPEGLVMIRKRFGFLMDVPRPKRPARQVRIFGSRRAEP